MSEERMSISENEQSYMESGTDVEEEQLELDEFSERRCSQLFVQKRLPQSKSDGHLLANAAPLQKRPRTPCFDESRNLPEIPAAFIRHSATYSGQVQGRRRK